MRVTVKVSVDIDPESWDLNYGTGSDRVTIGRDVRRYINHIVHEQLNASGVLKEED